MAHNSQSSAGVVKLTCNGCNRPFDDRKALKLHMLTCNSKNDQKTYSKRTPIQKTFFDGTKWEPSKSTKTTTAKLNIKNKNNEQLAADNAKTLYGHSVKKGMNMIFEIF